MNLQQRLRLDAAIATEEGQPLDDFISRAEAKRSKNRWPRQHTVRCFTPQGVSRAIRQELLPDL